MASSKSHTVRIPKCKFYVYGTNVKITRAGREFGIKGKSIDIWCARSVFEAQDAVNNLSNNRTYSNVSYTEGHPPQLPKTARIAVTRGKPTFVFGSASHQKFVRGLAARHRAREKGRSSAGSKGWEAVY